MQIHYIKLKIKYLVLAHTTQKCHTTEHHSKTPQHPIINHDPSTRIPPTAAATHPPLKHLRIEVCVKLYLLAASWVLHFFLITSVAALRMTLASLHFGGFLKYFFAMSLVLGFERGIWGRISL